MSGNLPHGFYRRLDGPGPILLGLIILAIVLFALVLRMPR